MGSLSLFFSPNWNLFFRRKGLKLVVINFDIYKPPPGIKIQSKWFKLIFFPIVSKEQSDSYYVFIYAINYYTLIIIFNCRVKSLGFYISYWWIDEIFLKLENEVITDCLKKKTSTAIIFIAGGSKIFVACPVGGLLGFLNNSLLNRKTGKGFAWSQSWLCN